MTTQETPRQVDLDGIISHPTDDPEIIAAREEARRRRVADQLHRIATADLDATD